MTFWPLMGMNIYYWCVDKKDQSTAVKDVTLWDTGAKVGYLPMGSALRMILWLPRVYSMSTVMGAEYVMSLRRHWWKHKQARDQFYLKRAQYCFEVKSRLHWFNTPNFICLGDHYSACKNNCIKVLRLQRFITMSVLKSAKLKHYNLDGFKIQLPPSDFVFKL